MPPTVSPVRLRDGLIDKREVLTVISLFVHRGHLAASSNWTDCSAKEGATPVGPTVSSAPMTLDGATIIQTEMFTLKSHLRCIEYRQGCLRVSSELVSKSMNCLQKSWTVQLGSQGDHMDA